MRILSLLCVYVLVLDSQGLVSIPAPASAKVSSHNFIHILEWSPGEGTQPGTVYNVKIDNNQAHSISGTSINLSEYMKDKFQSYNIKLWASFGNRSSSTVNIHFTPYSSTIIGPPRLSLSGCGDCLNISIDLPNRRDAHDSFYNTVHFDIEWMEAADEKDDCNNPHASYQSKRFVDYSYVLRYLKPGMRYCVKAQPESSSISASLSSCSCEFTSRTEPRGVAFLAGWVGGSLLVGLCFLSFLFGLVYTGFLCKPNIRLPKALIILAPGYVVSLEETHISAAEVEHGVQVHKQKREKEPGLFKQDDDDGDDDDEDKESHCAYMDRAVGSEHEGTGSETSASVSEVAENPGGCSFLDTPTEAPPQSDLVKGYNPAASLDSLATDLNAKEGGISPGRIKKEDVEEEDAGNVNLWSVVLKSMNPEEEDADGPLGAKEPLLPSCIKEFQDEPHAGSRQALLVHAQTESRKDENDDPDTGVCDHVGRTGYMASHTGTIGTENCLSEDDEDDCTSGYMAR